MGVARQCGMGILPMRSMNRVPILFRAFGKKSESEQ